MHYADRLQNRINETSPICISLNPITHKLPQEFPKTGEGALQFNQNIIDSVKTIVAAVSLNLAYYEALGPEGYGIFWLTCQYASEAGLIVIADGKRSDVPGIASVYANAYLYKDSPVDALTVSPYLGNDSIADFINVAIANEKGIYSIVKTSNAGSGDIQDMPIGDEVIHEHLAQLTEGWGMHHIGEQTNMSCVGAIVDATYPEELKYLRTIMPHLPLLLPEYGTEEHAATDLVHGFIADGTGALVQTTTNLLYSDTGKGWELQLHAKVEQMQSELKALIS